MAKKKASSKKPAKTCDCVSQVNVALDPQGLELDDRMVISFGDKSADGHMEAPLIQLRRPNGKKGKVRTMFCSYCPFCGVKKGSA